jgi:hypothetical protein
MTLSNKKKNGSKTRKRILKSRKNILRGGAGKVRFGKSTKAIRAPRPVSEPAPAPRSSEPAPEPKSRVRIVLNGTSVPSKAKKLSEQITKTATNVGQQAAIVRKQAVRTTLRATVFRNEVRKEEAKKKMEKFLKAVQAPVGEPPSKMTMEQFLERG